MKRMIISAALFLAVACSSLLEIRYVSGKVDGYYADITAIDSDVSSRKNEEALQKCRALEKRWENDVSLFETLLIHDYVDSIGAAVSKMRSHLENGSTDMFFAESTGAKKGLASIKGSEYPIFENIF